MFRKMRRIKNEISQEEAKDLLRHNKRAAFSVSGDDGYPYTIPIDFYYNEAENRIYFHSAKTGHKIDAVKANDKVCFTTWDDGYLEEGDWAYYVSSCVVFGRARLIEDAKLTEEKIRELALKYYPSAEEVEDEIAKDLKTVQLIAIDIEHISGKRVHER
jgi:nitroimidazol reductase NimA-like FMN-containing flavoprotein (pyridoxamine 5'-phosphate oxidase superfamily)